MKIRSYVDADYDDVAALWGEAFPDLPTNNDLSAVIARMLDWHPELFFVAVDNGTVVGAVMAGYTGHRGFIHYIAVRATHRRRGIGVALLKHAETALTAIGCPKLNLRVRGSNTAAIALYQKLGYVLEDHLSMAKLLTA